MIGSVHRFHGRSSLRFVFQRGQVVRGPNLSLRFIRNDRQQSYRMAVVVSRKVSKSAVVRNRIRRRLYEIVRRAAPAITEPYDIVFTVFSDEPMRLSHGHLSALALGQLQKAGILSKQLVPEKHRDIVEGKETDL